jgi:hypothetical protein
VRELEHAAEVVTTLHAVAPSPTLALWALNRTLDDADSTDERELLRAFSSIVNFCDAGYYTYAEAIALGWQAQADAALSAVHAAGVLLRPAPWFHNYGRRMVAEAAVRHGWGEPAVWFAQAESFFERNGNQAVASACRSLLRKSGATVPRAAAHRAVPEPIPQPGNHRTRAGSIGKPGRWPGEQGNWLTSVRVAQNVENISPA